MQDIQEIFNKIEESKKDMKELKASYKEALEAIQEYQLVQEEMKALREKRKRIEQAIKEQFATEITKIEDLKIDIESDMEMISDIALAKISKGESIGITDKYSNEYEPIFKVKFKKVS
ncbi:MAG: hypothetical protein COX80_00165 [Candidatus Magasanikbacteria bacterium CG_4_10_14_0_2_um_filter_33_14]|uniref:Uncharacterized protein n=1 Tax=Candidatus Magasanikbacteria bacterium CG_4_10_14_0_2_um_filter_33_14 TaxID=1974636 RepID=A0A2M7VC63_9BACT|nr:MAG: hypothetical protein COX80_00165 [Candidatus Magasanikbacteria bacterium CG_4_10_14_0_2_um_filter_33_14]